MNKIGMTSTLSTIVLICFLCAFSTPSVGQVTENQTKNTIKIGLLISDSSSVEAKFGAEYAVKTINKEGGLAGRQLEILTRSMEGPWGKGSKQAVDLIFDENVWAILGLHEGRNAHLVEQVIAKTKIVFLSAWAADPTLAQAYVPWYFSAAPNSLQQAEVILNDLNVQKDGDPWIVVSENGYDSSVAYKNLRSQIDEDEVNSHSHLSIEKPEDFSAVYQNIHQNNIKALVIFGQTNLSWQLIEYLRSKNVSIPFYGNLSLLGEGVFDGLADKDFKKVFLISNGNWINREPSSFSRDFQKIFGRSPGAMAAYAHDGILLLAAAIESSGFDRENLQSSLSETDMTGMTGKIQFDAHGNRKGLPDLIEINSKNLHPVRP